MSATVIVTFSAAGLTVMSVRALKASTSKSYSETASALRADSNLIIPVFMFIENAAVGSLEMMR